LELGEETGPSTANADDGAQLPLGVAAAEALVVATTTSQPAIPTAATTRNIEDGNTPFDIRLRRFTINTPSTTITLRAHPRFVCRQSTRNNGESHILGTKIPIAFTLRAQQVTEGADIAVSARPRRTPRPIRRRAAPTFTPDGLASTRGINTIAIVQISK
jgi:hypothetical protein